MAKADFYILNTSDSESRLNFLCRLVEKATGLGHAIYIHTNDESQASNVNEYMWSYKRDSFLPHEVITQDNQDTPVLIGYGSECGTSNDLLINLASNLPAFYKNFDRIAEIVIQNEATLKELRSHYRQIKQDKIESQIHDYQKNN